MNNIINIGLIGFGTVGESLYQVLTKSQNAKAEIKKIAIKDPNKKRSLPPGIFTTSYKDLIKDDSISLIVELIDDADEAFIMVKEALENGKSVVSGNKKMLAYHLKELIEIQEKTGQALLYDASACGSIPVIRNLEEYYDNDLLKSITGILNGSSNYILTQIFNHNKDYSSSLKLAQELGFAESNPIFDVEGFDSLYKLIILTLHGFGTVVEPDEVLNFGISKLSPFDIQYAREKGYRIKLVAQVTKINDKQVTLYVLPRLTTPDKYIYSVEDEFNGVVIQGEAYDKQFMFGKGAGGHPTASSVLSDITARKHNYRYEYKKRNYFDVPEYTTNHVLKIYLRYSNLIDLSHFEFEEIHEKFSSAENSYVVGNINLTSLLRIKSLLPKLNVFIAYLGDTLNTY